MTSFSSLNSKQRLKSNIYQVLVQKRALRMPKTPTLSIQQLLLYKEIKINLENLIK